MEQQAKLEQLDLLDLLDPWEVRDHLDLLDLQGMQDSLDPQVPQVGTCCSMYNGKHYTHLQKKRSMENCVSFWEECR